MVDEFILTPVLLSGEIVRIDPETLLVKGSQTGGLLGDSGGRYWRYVQSNDHDYATFEKALGSKGNVNVEDLMLLPPDVSTAHENGAECADERATVASVPKMYRAEGPNGELGDLAIWPEGEEPQLPRALQGADPTMRPSTPENIALAVRLYQSRALAGSEQLKKRSR